MEALKSNGLVVKIESSLAFKGFFSEHTEEEVNTYNHDALGAIRSQNIETLREFHQSGRPLKCSNSFGESLLHMACRRGFVDVASFLIKKAGVTVRVRDDYGNTHLRDVCWTCEPNFDLFELIMTVCPDLIFMSDRHGNWPLEYARREHWGAYVKLLSERHELLEEMSIRALEQ
jgi:ankyrin repeat protein